MTAMTSFAQTTVLWDGEDAAITGRNDNGGWWDRGNPSVVDNPDKSGINTSDKCLKLTMTGNDFGQKHAALPFRDWMTPNLNGRRRISMMIRKTNAENVLIELSDPTDGSDNQWKHCAAWYGGNGNWQKLVFDFSTNEGLSEFPGVMAITACTGNVAAPEDVYIDNIQIEDQPLVDGASLTTNDNGTLTGPLTITGTWMKGNCVNADTDPWTSVSFDDYVMLNTKLSEGVTSCDITGATLYDFDGDQFFYKNPNNIVYAATAYDHDNIVYNGNCETLNLNENFAFACPADFQAATVKITLSRSNGDNALVMPFWTSAADMGVAKIYTYKEVSDDKVVFKTDVTDDELKQHYADANIPFVAPGMTASDSQLTFYNKGVCTTPANYDTYNFRGVFKPQDAEGLWEIAGDGTLAQAAASTTIKAFHAYINDPENARSIKLSTDEVTGIILPTEGSTKYEIYNLAGQRIPTLQKGVNIIRNPQAGASNKKVIIRN